MKKGGGAAGGARKISKSKLKKDRVVTDCDYIFLCKHTPQEVLEVIDPATPFIKFAFFKHNIFSTCRKEVTEMLEHVRAVPRKDASTRSLSSSRTRNTFIYLFIYLCVKAKRARRVACVCLCVKAFNVG